MNFYQALQLDPSVLKQAIRKSESFQKKIWFAAALLVRAILCVGFAIVFIGTASAVFGPANQAAAVVVFCILLCVRFVDFGYRMRDSLLNLAVIFLILTVAPLLVQTPNPFWNLGINLLCLSFILVASCEQPSMGNAGLYLFGYIFLISNPVTGHEWILRILFMGISYTLCAVVFYRNHHKKEYSKTFLHVIKSFSFQEKKCQWQVQAAVGVSIAFFIGQLLHTERIMWIAFSCSSVLSLFPQQAKKRMGARVAGIVVGCFLFWILYQICPKIFFPFLGPAAGLCLGFCGTYHWKTICNCFGALMTATSLYGLDISVVLRIFHNIFGCILALFILFLFRFLFHTAKRTSFFQRSKGNPST